MNIFNKATFVIILLSLCSVQSFGQNPALNSNLILHFSKYVQWPSADGDFTIGVYGAQGGVDALTKASANRKKGTQNIKVIAITNVSQALKCDIVFLGLKKSSQLKTLAESTSTKPILLISNKLGLGKKGAGINIIIKNNKPAFELNLNAIKSNKLEVSPKLVGLGIVVG